MSPGFREEDPRVDGAALQKDHDLDARQNTTVLLSSSRRGSEKREAECRDHEGNRGEEEPNKRPKIIWFKPTNKRVPLIAIPTEQAPLDFVQNLEAYADTLCGLYQASCKSVEPQLI